MIPGTIYRPGQRVPISGIYGELTHRDTWSGRNVTCVLRKPFPPSQAHCYRYILLRATNP